MPAPIGHAPYPGCETGGRPKIYTPDVLNKLAAEFIKWADDPKSVFVEEFAHNMKLSKEYLSIWAKESDKFSQAYLYAKEKQEFKLKHGAIKKQFSENMSKFLLINNHGVQKYADKTETTISGELSILEGIVNQTKELIDDKTTAAEDTGRTGCY